QPRSTGDWSSDVCSSDPSQREAQDARSWQGWSNASWQFSGTTAQFHPGPTSLGQIKRAGTLRVATNNLRAGYLRKNGVPFSENRSEERRVGNESPHRTSA